MIAKRSTRDASVQLADRNRTSFTLLATADFHVHDPALLFLAAKTLAPDVVILAGDGLLAGAARAGASWLADLATHTRFGVLAVAGNADGPDAVRQCGGARVYDLDRDAVHVGPVFFTGLGGVPRPTRAPSIGLGAPLYGEADAYQRLTRRVYAHPGPVVLVSHAPPYGIRDATMPDGIHAGSRAVRQLLDTQADRVRLVICGHVHSSAGRHAVDGGSVVWNVAARQRDPAALDLLYLHVEWRDGQLHLADVAVHGPVLRWTPAGELGFLPWMSTQIAAKLMAAGVTTIRQLAQMEPPHVARCLGSKRADSAAIWPARAQAFVRNQAVPLGPLPIGPRPRWYLDIETDPNGAQECVWAVALCDHDEGHVRQWFLTRLRGQRGLLRAVAGALAELPAGSLYAYSGSRFDERILAQHMQRHGIEVPPALAEAGDLYQAVRRAYALPRNPALKEAISAFSIVHRLGHIDGMTAAIGAMGALRRGRPIPSRYLRYNREDARVLRALVLATAQQVGTTDPLPRRSRPSGGALRKAADERRVAEMLAQAHVTVDELATEIPWLRNLLARGGRLTSQALERALQHRGARSP